MNALLDHTDAEKPSAALTSAQLDRRTGALYLASVSEAPLRGAMFSHFDDGEVLGLERQR